MGGFFEDNMLAPLSRPGTPQRSTLTGMILFGFVAILLLCRERHWIRPSTAAPSGELPGEVFEWLDVTPSPSISWTACYAGFQCARLELPLDYDNPQGETTAIAIVKRPSSVQDNRYKGPIIFNPGGPGTSGVNFIHKNGEYFHQVLGEEYDVVGFDPRGVQYTTPAVNVFRDPLQRAAWDLRHADSPLVNESKSALAELAATSALIGELVAARAPVVARHMNTALVSRDMLEMVRAMGFEKLKYWGFSYGTILGATFASMFPERVERMVLDGVANSVHHYQGEGWEEKIRLADKGLAMIFKECADSGRSCPMNEPTGEAVKDRYHRLLAALDSNPITFGGKHGAVIITRRLVHRTLFYTLLRPYKEAKQLFYALQALESNDGGPFYNLITHPEDDMHCDCPPKSPSTFGGPESGRSVTCTDSGPKIYDVRRLQDEFEKMAAISEFGDIWSELGLRCIGWRVTPASPWRGPIGSNATAFPLLFVGNTADPVTHSAEEMSRLFRGSAILTQDSAGHCSIAATSACTSAAIRAYFRDGTLPVENTVCGVDDHMFPSFTRPSTASSDRGNLKLQLHF